MESSKTSSEKENDNLQKLDGYKDVLLEIKNIIKSFEEKNASIDVKKESQLNVLRGKINSAIEDDRLLNCLDEIIKDRKNKDKLYVNALKHAYDKINKSNKNAEEKRKVFTKILTGLKLDEIGEPFTRNAQRVKVSFESQDSFRANMVRYTRKRQLGNYSPEWFLDKKSNGFAFIDELGVERPWASNKEYKLTEIPMKKGIVVKPTNGSGSNGVYLVIDLDNIRDVKRKKVLTSWDAFKESMKEDISSGKVKRDVWNVEELIFEDEDQTEPSRDLKFFCFYGQPALILEVCRYPETRYCWWDINGNNILTGKYEDRLFQGQGINDEMINLASFVSSEIPSAFLRIDFLKTPNGMKFGEFTLRPGLFEQFNKKTDRLLGTHYLDAEGRLVADLLSGKEFRAFSKIKSTLT
ncbi:hypothetical protein N0O92_08835 [Alkalihalobacillus sp. MEB130]|uniref:ATP-grasp fold amidoligase family protein n=1 Tax=Alkalihalobacillus sp. MEB130 TaxID=2976704 RepID=UPI0028DD864C|nr:ATP-grasp fold amidoligase family protein [Alkalihalobacillus sp. MEB130]MDT8860337.1 hypothetical protein [Alkalihalobacillus sp. MEB130]